MTRFAPLGASNYGIAGSLTHNLRWLLKNGGLAHRPQVVVIQIGINNLSALGASPQATAMGVLGVLREVRLQSPGSQVLLLGLYPPDAPGQHPLSRAVEQTNALLARHARGPGVTFVDLGGALRQPDGRVQPDLYANPLHLAPAGYERVAAALEVPLRDVLEAADRAEP